MKTTIEILRLPLSLNHILRANRWSRMREQKVWDFHIIAAWVQSDQKKFLNPVRIKFLLYFHTDRRRDYDNYLGGTKYIIDALKRTFLTRDDYKMVKSVSLEFFVDHHGDQRTVILIEEEK